MPKRDTIIFLNFSEWLHYWWFDDDWSRLDWELAKGVGYKQNIKNVNRSGHFNFVVNIALKSLPC